MKSSWPIIRIVSISVIGTVLAQICGLYMIGWFTQQQLMREKAERADIYRAASFRLGMPETTEAERIRVYVDCERLIPGVLRETLEAILRHVGPYTANQSEPYPNGDYVLSVQFADAAWRGVFHLREYRFDVTHHLMSSGWRDTSAFSEVECPWRYLTPLNE